MHIIQAETVDIIAEQVNNYNETSSQALLDEIYKRQPAIFNYILSKDETALFSQDEKELLIYITFVLWQTVKQELRLPQRVGMKQLDAIQATNWQKAEALPSFGKGQTFEAHLSSFFDGYPQDELLGLITDLLDDVEDEVPMIAKESRLPLFIMLKTVTDVLLLGS